MAFNIKHIPEPAFGSELNTVIVELEKLREKKLQGAVPPHIFFQLKEIFQALESLGSTRIEGNRTTITEYAEKIIMGVKPDDEGMREISNLDKAISFIEENIKPGTPITRGILSEIHKIVTNDLTPPPAGEGSKTPGFYRAHNVEIQNSQLKTTEHILVPEECEELLSFINDDYATQYHLLVMALAHHRFTVVHPFDNGNGRVVRVLTYAQLLQQGFSIKSGRILNPTAVFCDNRDNYYDMLSRADEGTDEAELDWCLYVLKGLAREIEKIDKLLNRDYLRKEILLPAINRALESKYITDDEFALFNFIVNDSEDMTLRSSDVKYLLGIENATLRSRVINKLLDKSMLETIEDGGRIYTISFFGNFLFRVVAQVLIEKGFAPESLNKN